jgi:hypothetical protein
LILSRMPMYPLMSFGWLAVFLGLFSSSTSAQPDPELGTWTLNRVRSSYDPGPPLNTQVRTVETVGEYHKLHDETSTGNGTLAIVGYMAKFDGRD